jgi:diguanylate cyclase (GGDEF)-like protein
MPADLEALAAAVRESPPAAIIMDAGAPDAEADALKTLADIQRGREEPIAAVVISSHGDLQARLRAVRAGASAYLTKPVDLDELIDRLDMLTTRDAREPFRVLVVDDSPDLANYLAGHLQQAGMRTAVVTDPMEVMGPLTELNPDLILMDLYMPGCTGLELAAVIRQQPDYLSTPIVFLSAETDRNTQIEALRLGGDDFLTKPVQISHLVSSVASRTLRSRTLRALIIRDSLTGLLNHTATEERLADEVTRAQRRQRSLAYALIDLDSFKKVNDTYGHATGDRVLISLSRLLQQRLRKSDVIGRVGGEEFVIIFTDTDGPTAARVLNEIRERFSSVRHSAQGVDFYVTLSGGVSSYPERAEPASLNEAADKALYEAKQQGRNRVVLAG